MLIGLSTRIGGIIVMIRRLGSLRTTTMTILIRMLMSCSIKEKIFRRHLRYLAIDYSVELNLRKYLLLFYYQTYVSLNYVYIYIFFYIEDIRLFIKQY